MKSVFKIKNWQLLRARGAEGNVALPKGDFASIGKRAFVGKHNPYLQSVRIPDGVSVIKAEAFARSQNLRTVILPTSGGIGLHALARGSKQRAGQRNWCVCFFALQRLAEH